MILEKYEIQKEIWPTEGKHILAQFDEERILVYQSYRPKIGNFAIRNQFFGEAFKYTRMTWIKPNFLWMMYRNGWASKEGQEVCLAIHLKREAFENYLKKAVTSSFDANIYATREQWKEAMHTSEVRLQWDPDHNPYGVKETRKAIQIGLKGDTIVSYAKEDILKMEDISDYVREQGKHVANKRLDLLEIPRERVYPLDAKHSFPNLGM